MKKPTVLTNAVGVIGQQEVIRKSGNDSNVELPSARHMRRALASAKRRGIVISDGNATAAGMNRLFEGKNVKDTVKDNG